MLSHTKSPLMACVNSKAFHFIFSPSRPRSEFSTNHASFHFSPNPKKGRVQKTCASIQFSSNSERTNTQKGVQTRLENKQKSGSTNQILPQLQIIADTAADRAEMHAIIGQQRNNWNHLFLNSINSMNLFATLMAGLSGLTISKSVSILLAFKIPSTLLFSFSTMMMIIVNWIQPSQLAEEQRNATRLFKQLERSLCASIRVGYGDKSDIDKAMERVLALDLAYPLSLAPGMLDKFPKKVKPTTWWPRFDFEHGHSRKAAMIDNEANGWNNELEEEMKNILKILKGKDEEQYLVCGEVALKINRVLAITGPVFAGLAAIGSLLIGFSNLGHIPVIISLTCGSLAVIVNSLEHGGQIGMVFEMFRNSAGFYKHLEEEIEGNLKERDLQKRENGELFETKMALQLGRSTVDLKHFELNGDGDEDGDEEFAGKLF